MAIFGQADAVSRGAGAGAGAEAAAEEETVDGVGLSEGEGSILGLAASSSMWGVGGADATAGEVVNSAPGDKPNVLGQRKRPSANSRRVS